MYCTICRKTVKRNVKLHIAQHYKATKFHCRKCSKRFEYRSSLDQHEKIAHKKELLQCNIGSCSKAYKSRKGLTYHKNNFHKIMSERSLAASKSWICSQCSKHFCSRGNLKRHQNLHCKQGKDKESKMFVCIACHPIKHFKCKQYYREHKTQYHSSSSKYTCSNCNLQFHLRHAYYYHVKRKCSVGNMKI